MSENDEPEKPKTFRDLLEGTTSPAWQRRSRSDAALERIELDYFLGKMREAMLDRELTAAARQERLYVFVRDAFRKVAVDGMARTAERKCQEAREAGVPLPSERKLATCRERYARGVLAFGMTALFDIYRELFFGDDDADVLPLVREPEKPRRP